MMGVNIFLAFFKSRFFLENTKKQKKTLKVRKTQKKHYKLIHA